MFALEETAAQCVRSVSRIELVEKKSTDDKQMEYINIWNDSLRVRPIFLLPIRPCLPREITTHAMID